MTSRQYGRMWCLAFVFVFSGCVGFSTEFSEPATHAPATRLTTSTGTPQVTPSAIPTARPLDIVRVAVQGRPNVLNPFISGSDSEELCIELIYETLMSYGPSTGLGAGLAAEMTWDDDHGGVTFALDPDARWSDGQPVTTDDVVATFAMLRDQRLPIYFAVARSLAEVTKVDDRTVHVALAGPAVDAPRFVGTIYSIVPRHVWRDVEDAHGFANAKNPIGSGPFAVVDDHEQSGFLLQSVPGHRSGVAVDGISLQVINEESVAVLALKVGDLDALSWNVPPDAAAHVRDHPEEYPGVRLAQAAGVRTTVLVPNLRREPFSDDALRKALAQGIDSRGLIARVLLGFGDPVGPGLVPAMSAEWHNPDIEAVVTDKEQAAQRLDNAGYRDLDGDGWRDGPDGEAMAWKLLCSTVPMETATAQWLVADLADMGLRAEVDAVDPGAIRSVQARGDFDLLLSSVDLTEPGMFGFYLGGSRGVIEDGAIVGYNLSGYASDKYDGLVEASAAAFDADQRQRLLWQAQEVLADDMPLIPLYAARVLNLYRDDRFEGWVVRDGEGIVHAANWSNLRPR